METPTDCYQRYLHMKLPSIARYMYVLSSCVTLMRIIPHQPVSYNKLAELSTIWITQTNYEMGHIYYTRLSFAVGASHIKQYI